MDNTDPTRPTPPPAPTLAPVAAPPAALVLPGGWQIEGLPDIVLRAGPQAAERTVEVFHGPDPQPAYPRGVRHGRDAVLYLVRRTRARA